MSKKLTAAAPSIASGKVPAPVKVVRRLRHGGSQTLRVEHVHVNEGGQAVIGNGELHSRIGPIGPRRRPCA